MTLRTLDFPRTSGTSQAFLVDEAGAASVEYALLGAVIVSAIVAGVAATGIGALSLFDAALAALRRARGS